MASFSRIFLIDAPECTPRSFALSRRTSLAILEATLSAALGLPRASEVVDLSHSDLVSSSLFFSAATLLAYEALDALDCLEAPDSKYR